MCLAIDPSCLRCVQVQLYGQSIYRSMKENGRNRFHCFPCDYSLCDDCVKRRIRGDVNREWRIYAPNDNNENFVRETNVDDPDAPPSYYTAVYPI